MNMSPNPRFMSPKNDYYGMRNMKIKEYQSNSYQYFWKTKMKVRTKYITQECMTWSDLSDDCVRIILEFASEQMTELLNFALVNKQMQKLCLEAFPTDENAESLSRALRNPHVAQQIIQMSVFPVAQETKYKVIYKPFEDQILRRQEGYLSNEDIIDIDSFMAGEFQRPSEQDNLILHCSTCYNPILLHANVISPNYRIATGRAYLALRVSNVDIEEDTTFAAYTSGVYEVARVKCSDCKKIVGVKYVGANDPGNSYKVHKYLLGQQQLRMPDCCIGLLPCFPHGACTRCHAIWTQDTLCLILHMTNQLNPYHNRKFLDLLSSQQREERDHRDMQLAFTVGQKPAPPPGLLLDTNNNNRRKVPRLLRQFCHPWMAPINYIMRNNPMFLWSENLLERLRLPQLNSLSRLERRDLSDSMVEFSDSFRQAATQYSYSIGLGDEGLRVSQSAVLSKMVPSLMETNQETRLDIIQTIIYSIKERAGINMDEIRTFVQSVREYIVPSQQSKLEHFCAITNSIAPPPASQIMNGPGPVNPPVAHSAPVTSRADGQSMGGYLRCFVPNILPVPRLLLPENNLNQNNTNNNNYGCYRPN